MYVHIDSFSRSTRLQFQTLCFTQIYPFSDFWYMHFEAVRDILEIRRSLLVEDIFERIPSYFHTCVEIHILLFIVNIIPFILYLMLLFSLSIPFYQTKSYFYYFFIFLACFIFPITEIGIFLLSFRRFVSTISSISLLSALFTLSFPINRNCIFLSSPFHILFLANLFRFYFFFYFYFHFRGFFLFLKYYSFLIALLSTEFRLELTP